MTDSLTATFQSDLQSRYNGAQADVQAQIASRTGVDTSSATVQSGASAAVSLLQNGYDPSSDSDNTQLVQAIAGGLAAIGPATGGVGFILSGAVEALWAIGSQVDCPIESAFASIGFGSKSPACGGQPCTTSGNWSASSIMSDSQLPAMPRGSFASLVIPAIATNTAKAMNCKSSMPPGQVVDAVVAVWNQIHAGPAVDYFIPPLAGIQIAGGNSAVTIGNPIIIPFWQNVSDSVTSNVDPNVFFAFQPVSVIVAAEASRYGMDITSDFESRPTVYFPIASGLWVVTQPRIVSLNIGPLISLGPSASTTSTTTVAGHAAALGGGAVLGGLLYAWASGKAIDTVFSSAFSILKGWVGQAAGEVDSAFAAAETSRRRKR